MKLLLVTNSLSGGGKERQIIELAKVLKRRNVNFKVICFSLNASVPGIEIINDSLIIIDRSAGYFKTQRGILSEIRKFNPDIVHVWDNYGALMSIMPKVFLHFQLVDGSIRGGRRYLKRLIYMSLTYAFTSKIVANSLAGLRSNYRKTNKRNVVIYNGFDINRIKNLDSSFDIKKKLHISDKKVIGMVANIRKAKDYPGFIKVAERILRKRNDVIFISLGDGEIRDQYYLTLNPSIKKQIYFLGKVNNTEEYIKSFDIGILLNDPRYGKEGISNAIMEYMAAKLPVIATNIGGTPEIVNDNNSGYLVPAFGYDLIEQKILLLLDHKEKRRQMGEKGEEILKEKFSLMKMEREYLDLYHDLMSR